MKSFFIETWGCQMNDHDSEKMAGLLSAMGMEPAEKPETADVYLLNTCSVREKAQEKIFSRLGVLRPLKARRSMVIGVLGCVAQQEGERIFRRAPYVDLVLGPQALQRLPQLVTEALDGQGRQVCLASDPEIRPVSRQALAIVSVHVTWNCPSGSRVSIISRVFAHLGSSSTSST